MPKPIQHLIETIGAKPTLLGSGALSLGGATLSTASFTVGFFTLLAATGVLPNGLASLGVAGGIVFTAAGPIGLFTSAGFFVFMATRVRSALQTRPSGESVSEKRVVIKEVEEKKVGNPSSLEEIYAQFDKDLEAARKLPPENDYNADYFRIEIWPQSHICITIFGRINKNNFLCLGDKPSKQIPLELTHDAFMDGLAEHIRNNYKCEIKERKEGDARLVLKFEASVEEEQEVEETEEEKEGNTASLETIYSAFDTDLKTLRNLEPRATLQSNFFYLSDWPENRIFITCNHIYKNGHLHILDFKDPDTTIILKNTTFDEFMNGLIEHINSKHSCTVTPRNNDEDSIILTFAKIKEDNT